MRKIQEPHFSFIFEDIGDSASPSKVRVIKHHSGQEANVLVALRDLQFLNRHLEYMPPLLADCADLAVAVYIADGLSTYYQEARTHVHVELPLRHPELWNAAHISAELDGLLNWFTHHLWTFHFSARKASPRIPELQTVLQFPVRELEVNLWSGGLDALAGFYTRFSQQPQRKHILFATGGDFYIEHVQKSLGTLVGQRTHNQVELVQVPLRFKQDPTRQMTKNPSQRSRGFVFLLLGLICACLHGQDELFVYENGIGAINLTFSRSQEGRSQNVAVHPLSLQRMSRLMSKVLGTRITFLNPFVTWTKAEMCEVLKYAGATDLVRQTISCDSRRRAFPSQCGCCSSCLLRRQALLSAGISDETQYGVLIRRYVPHPAFAKPPRTGLTLYDSGVQPTYHSSHLRAMLKQVDTIRSHLLSSDPWLSMAREWKVLRKIVEQTALLDGAVPITEDQLLSLYKRYIEEWSDPYVLESLWSGLSSGAERYAKR